MTDVTATSGATADALTDQPPAYVRYGAQASVPPPYQCRGTTLWAFGVQANPALLASLCDRVFSQPTGGAVAYEPVGSRLLLTFGTIPTIESMTAPFDQQGAVQEGHAGLWMLVRRVAGDGPALAVFTPYMWVDNPMSLVAGRETFGYPKTWGWPAMPAAGVADPRWTLDVYGGDFVAGAARKRRPLLRIAPAKSEPTPAPTRPPSLWHELHEVVDHLVKETATELHLAGLEALMSEFADASLPQVFLKETPAPGASGASLVQVCAASITVERFVGWPVFDHHDVTVEKMDSDPLVGELGVTSQTTWGAFHVTEMDMVLGAGEVVWDGSDAH